MNTHICNNLLTIQIPHEISVNAKPPCVRLHLTTACMKRVPVTKRLSKPINHVTKFSASMHIMTANHVEESQKFGY